MKKKPTVLIIDDDQTIRDLYSDALGGAGFEVLTAADGEEGVETALKEHPDVLLVDIMMKKMDGHEAVAKLRRDSWGKSAKVIFLTNLSDPDDVIHAIEQGPEEYIVKANTEIKDVVNTVRLASRM